MIKGVLVFLAMFGISSLLIFGHRAIRKSDVVVSGKLIVAAIISIFITIVIFIIENQ